MFMGSPIEGIREVPDVPEHEVTDWSFVTERLGDKLINKAASLGRSVISYDTNCDLEDLFWVDEVLPLCVALLKMEPNHEPLKTLRDWIVDGRENRDRKIETFFSQVFQSDPLLSTMCDRMGASWMQSRMPLIYQRKTSMGEVMLHLDSFEHRLDEFLRFLAFPRRTLYVCAALGIGTRFARVEAGFLELREMRPRRVYDAYTTVRERFE